MVPIAMPAKGQGRGGGPDPREGQGASDRTCCLR